MPARLRALCLAAVVPLALTACEETPAASSPSTTAPPVATVTDEPPPLSAPAGVQKAVVDRIVDGDTLELHAVSPGPALSSTQQVDVRLLEIDTPETKHPSEPVQCFGAEATDKLTELAPPGSFVWVQRDVELRDQYGRYLLYLWNDQGVFVNLKLVATGHAAAKLYEPNDKHWPKISAAEQQARQADAGLWGACPEFGAPVNTPEPNPEPAPQDTPEPNPEPNTPAPQPEPEPQPEPQPEDHGNAYPVPPPPPDLDCGDVAASNFRVRPGDPHRFDSDGDGYGCEG